MSSARRRIAVALVPALLCVSLATAAARAQGRDLDIPIMVQTVPHLPGARFTLDDRSFVADEHGLALITVDEAGTFTLAAPRGKRLEGGARVEFARWGDDVFEPERAIHVDSFTYLQAGFDTLQSVVPSFVDAQGNDLEPIDSLTLVDDLGVARTYPGGAPLWLRTERVTAEEDGLKRRAVAYELGRVRLADGTVAGQPGLVLETPEAGGPWRIELSFNDVAIAASDALFGAPVTGEATLQGPGGPLELDLDEEGRAVAESLPPGRYVARVGGGLTTSETSFTLPRETSVRARVLTFGDAAAVALVVAAIVGAGLAARRISRLEPRRAPVPAVAAPGSLTTAARSPEGVQRGGNVRIPKLLRAGVRRAPEAATGPQAPERESTDALTAKLQALAEEIDAAAAALSDLRREKGVIEAELASERARLAALQRDKEAVVAGLSTEGDELRGERDRLGIEVERVRTEARAAEEALRSQLDSLMSERDSLQAELGDARTNADRVATERDSLHAALGDARGRADRGAMELKAALAAVKAAGEVSSELDSLRVERDLLRKQRDDVRAEVIGSRSERDALNGKLKNALTQLVAADEARAERDDLRAERDEMRAELAALRADKEALNDKLKGALAQLVPMEQLRAERDELRARMTPAEGSGEGDPLHQALGRLVRAETIRSQREDLRAQVSGLRRENSRLQKRLRALGAEPDEGIRAVPEPPQPTVSSERPVVRLEDAERAQEGEETAEPWWRAFIHEAEH